MVEEAISFWSEIQRFENMLEADPRSLSFAPLSELYRKLGLLDDAISVAKKGCALHPDYPGGFFALGSACLDKGLQSEARAALETVLRLSPEHLRAQKLLGQVYVELGEHDLARDVLARVLRQNPDDAESELLLASIGTPAEGGAEGEEILEDLEVLEELEVVEEAEEAEISGLAEFEEAGALAPAAPVAPASPGAAAPRPPAAAPDAGRHPSRDPLTTATLAELYVSQGFLDKAIGIYQELLGPDPENPTYRLRLAELKSALERQQDTGEGAPVPLEVDEPQQEDFPDFDEPMTFEEAPALEEPMAFQEPPPFEEPVAFEEPGAFRETTAVHEPKAPEKAPEASFGAPAAPGWQAEPEPALAQAFEAQPATAGWGDAGGAPAPGQQEPTGDLETELSRWLENIRRRRDGL